MKNLFNSTALISALALALLQTTIFAQKHTLKYDLANLQSGYALINLGWQYQVSDRVAFEASAALFRAKKTAAPPLGETTVSQYYTDDFFINLLLVIGYGLTKPDEGQFGAVFNQRGSFAEIGMRLYFGKNPAKRCRYFLKPNVQRYSFYYDEFTVTRTSMSVGLYERQIVDRSSLSIGKHATQNAGLLNFGAEIRFLQNWTADFEIAIPVAKTGERFANRQKDAYDFPQKLKDAAHSPVRHNHIFPLSLKIGHRF